VISLARAQAWLWLAILCALVPVTAEGAIAFRSAASRNLNGQASSITITKPTGTAKGDVLIAVIAVRPHTVTITAPSGWSLVNRQNNSNGSQNALAVYYKVAANSEPASYAWSFSSNTGSAGGILAFSGVDNTSPIDVNAGALTTTSTTSFQAPSVNTTVANTMLVIAHEFSSSERWTAATGTTEVFDVASLAVSDELGIATLGSYRSQAAAGASGTFTATAAGNADTGAAITTALRPVVCGAVGADPDYFAATARNGQALLYWASTSPVVVLAKTTAFGSEVPASGVSYVANDTIGTATVVYSGSAQGVTLTGLTNGTTYYYKAFTQDGTPCYSSGTALATTPAAGPAPAWSYTMAGGSMLNGGIAGDSAVYTSSNADRIVSVNIADGSQTWAPLATTAAVQGALTWIPVDTGIHTVQRGTAAMTTQAVLNVPIATVDLNRAVVFMSVSGDTSDPNTGLVRGRLTSATNLQFNRPTAGANLTIRWSVASFGRSVSVQRGTTSVTTSPLNVTIGPVDRTKSFVLVSWSKLGATYGADDILRARLTSNTNLELSHGTGAFDGVADWQVVTMESASVQSGDLTMAANALSATATVTAVDTTKTFLLASWTSDSDGVGENFIRGRITSPTQLTFDRGVTGATIGLSWFLVTLNDGSTVQSGNASFAAGTLTVPVTLPTAVTASRAVAFLSGNQRGGSTPDPGTSPNDNAGVAWFRADLTGATTLQLTRATDGAGAGVSAQAAWFVVDFATAPGASVFGGDQSGQVYYVDTANGVADWAATPGADAVQAATTAQVLAFSNAGFQAVSTDDLLFAATRNVSTTNNKVFALRASDGTVQWTFNGTGTYTMDYVVGTPWLDYTRNRLYVASRAGTGGTQPSLWVINTLDGTLVQSFALGHLQSSPTVSWDESTLYVGNSVGRLYAINLNTVALKWTTFSNLGSAVVGYVWEDVNTAGRLYFSTANGNVWCLQDPGAGAPPNGSSPVWMRAVAGASTPLLLDKIYVGSSDGRVHQINLTTGVDEKQFTVGSGTATVGTPSTDGNADKLFVGTSAGTLYQIPLPLP
jgi:outer membrane protein assembly factor BamB